MYEHVRDMVEGQVRAEQGHLLVPVLRAAGSHD
jgi:hypothetical protein